MDREISDEAASFLVCGLGSLGQHCVLLLKEFGAQVRAIDVTEAQHWEVPNLQELLDQRLIGDCRQSETLEQAKIQECRAILLVTSDERVNIAAAFAARSLNPQIRLVIRSAQENLNQLLSQQLGNFVAYEPTQLPAAAFALAALGDTTQGFFSLEDVLVRVVKFQVPVGHPWCDRRSLYELNTSTRRILTHQPNHQFKPLAAATSFYQWEPTARIQPDDILTYIEATDRVSGRVTQPTAETGLFWQGLIRRMAWQNLRQVWLRYWRESNQTQRVAVLSSLIMVSLFLVGALLFKLQYPHISPLDALNLALVICLGGFDNVFGDRQIPFPIPWWLYLISVAMTVAGTLFIGILYAILTERVLAARFQFLRRRPPIPRAGHVVLVGLGRIGQGVAVLLQELRQPLVGLTALSLDAGILPDMPAVIGAFKDTLTKANLATAKSVVVVTDDEVANLEIGLMARTLNPSCNLVLRTVDQRFANNVARLLPDARVLGAYALASEAFVGAAFGENILALFRLNDRTTLVTEYEIEAGDTLNGKLLADMAYGYGVVPILHQRRHHESARLMPSDDTRLQVGDRLVVLATIEGLQRVEYGQILVRPWLLRVEKVMSDEAAFEGAAVIARISGCDIAIARSLMNHLPATLQFPLYQHQALRLVRELHKTRVSAHLVRDGGEGEMGGD